MGPSAEQAIGDHMVGDGMELEDSGRNEPWRPGSGSRLWSWQRDALSAWKKAGHIGVVQAVTGTGKTMVGIAAIALGLKAGLRCVVLVPTDALVKQWVKALNSVLSNAAIAVKGE